MARTGPFSSTRARDIGPYFRGKVALVTAAGSGIGRACALAYGRAGARVHLADLREDRVRSVEQEARSAGLEVMGHVLDAADPEQVASLGRTLLEQEPHLDIVQSGVGILVAGPVEALTLADWQRAVQVNLFSTVYLLHALLPRLLAQGRESHLVVVASFAGLMGFPFTAPYTATKFALVGLCESLSAELQGRGVCVTAVCPGAVSTNLMRDGNLDLPGSWRERLIQTVEQHATSPDRVAQSVLEAVRDHRRLIVPTVEVWPLWLLKRASASLCDATARHLTHTLRRLGG